MRSHGAFMDEAAFSHIRRIFDVPVMQNHLRGLWVEAVVCELLGNEWRFTGSDWAAWDFEGLGGVRVEVKQSAKKQSWGHSTSLPRFGISAAQGHYPDGKTYRENVGGHRFADIYIFAWHEGDDQRRISEWMFYVIDESALPPGQKSIGLSGIRKLAAEVAGQRLRAEVKNVAREICRRSSKQ